MPAARPLFVASALFLVACRGTGNGPCGSAYVYDTYADPGPWADIGGWYVVGGDDSSGDGTGDPGYGYDPSSGDPSSSDPSSSDPSSGGDSSSGDPSSGDDGSGDFSSGDDGTNAIRHPRIHSMLHVAAAAPAPVVAADANGCYSCTLTCVLTAAPAGQPNAASAIGASGVGTPNACSDAQAELASWARQAGSSLQACRVGDGASAGTARVSAQPKVATAGLQARTFAGAGRWMH